jgi:flagellar hook protein FlgE
MVNGNGPGSYAAGGLRTSSTRLIDQSASLVSTGNSTDLAVRGRGLLPVMTESDVAIGNGEDSLLLSTTGSFRPDALGYLRSPAGLVLMGWPATASGDVPAFPRDSIDGLEPIQINSAQFAGEATTRIDLAVNLPATSTEADSGTGPETLSVEYFDNLGKSSTLNLSFTPSVPAAGSSSSNQWTLVVSDSESAGAIIGEYTINFDATREGGGPILSVVDVSGGPYDSTTGELSLNVAGGPIDISIGTPGSAVGLTQLSNAFAPTSISKNGTPVGSMTSIEVDKNGYVRASFDIGITRTLYQIPLVDVSNVNGLETQDSQTYRATNDSGSFFLWDAGDGPTGDIVGFAREESATDVAGELTQLIQTQRAYSSNAKVIQTVDEMLQETTNIKR